MTLVAADEFTTTIAKAAGVDPDGTAELLRFGLYETLCGMIDLYRPMLDTAAAEVVAKRHDAAMATLAKRFAEKRASGLDTSEEEAAAEALETVAKSFADWFRSPEERQRRSEQATRQARDAEGRFAHMSGAADQLNTWAGHNSQNMTSALESYASGREEKNAYTRLSAIGAGLKAVSSNKSPASQIGLALENVAALGPSAQKVLQPGIQRAAYRYRGTERTPPLALQQQVYQAYRLSPQGRGGRYREIVAYYGDRPGFSRDQRKLGAASDVATAELMKNLPDLKLTELSANADAYPPSEGIIITADGDAAVQAVGYNGDHFLPFDLKNLRRLSGGAYVRTRAIGGPTTEDIYTGLLTNTRRIQVVSNSGVFTVDFDPHLRGGRRYSDKARQMVARYGQLLKAVDSGKVYERDLQDTDPVRARQIKRDAYKIYRSTTSPEAQAYISDETEKAVFEARDVKDAELQDQAAREVLGENYGKERRHYTTEEARDIKDTYHELVREQRQNSPEKFKLNGEGYFAAMKALQQQFPYYVRRVDYKPLPEWESQRGIRRGPHEKKPPPKFGGTDSGFVVPGGVSNRPHALRQQSRGYSKPEKEEGGQAATTSPRTPSGGGGGGAVADTDLRAISPGISIPAGSSFDDALSGEEGVLTNQLAATIAKMQEAILLHESPALPWEDHSEQEINNLTGANFVQGIFLRQDRGSGDPTRTAKYLLSEHGRKNLPKFARGLKDLNREVSVWEMSGDSSLEVQAGRIRSEISEEDADQAADQVAELANITSPLRPMPEGGWVLSEADPGNPKPLKIPNIEEYANKRGSLDLYLKRVQPVAEAVDELEGRDNREIGTLINGEITAFNRLAAWGKKLQGADPDAPMPGGLPDGTQKSDAMAAHNNPTQTPQYARIRNLQTAWAVIAARDAAAQLEELAGGVGGGAEERPKARPALPGPDEQVSMRLERPRVVVYRADSAVAKAYARLSAESKRGRLVAL